LKTRSLLVLAVLLLAAIAGGAYYAQTLTSSNSTPGSLDVHIAILGGVGAGTVDTYSPDNFTVKQGQHVTLAVLNTDDNSHGLAITQFEVDTGIIGPGNTVRVSFVANQTGTFKFFEPDGYCKGGVGNVCNSQQKMVGNMTVLP
jgi:heme/copper-type cytochrome/quinol oxidase subunit 2